MNYSLINKIRLDIKKKKLDGYLITNNDIHLNENTNLELKPVFQVINFDSSFCYLIVLDKKISLFTDKRYLLQAKKELIKKKLKYMNIVLKISIFF